MKVKISKNKEFIKIFPGTVPVMMKQSIWLQLIKINLEKIACMELC